MKAWKAILAALIIFCAGAATGMLLLRAYFQRHPPAVTNVAPAPVWARLEFMRHAQKQLDLSEAQHEKIDRIITEGQNRLRSLWEPVAPEMQSALRQIREGVLAELNPQQRACFEELSKSKGTRRGESSAAQHERSRRKERTPEPSSVDPAPNPENSKGKAPTNSH
jgi:hypothetical protein